VRHRGDSKAGFSLVAVLIVMGVVLLSVLFITQAKFRTQETQKGLKVKQSYADINQALMSSVVDIFHKGITASCNDLVQHALASPQPLDGNVTFQFNTDVPIAHGKNGSTPQAHREAKSRCAAPKSPNGGNRFYFCVSLTKDTSAPKDSILNADAAFAEFAVELIDLQTQSPITCQDYESRRKDLNPTTGQPRDGSAGMAVTMALYWANRLGAQQDNYVFSQKTLSYIANQN
jgi:type II secretory pathway pseudopilin PulG